MIAAISNNYYGEAESFGEIDYDFSTQMTMANPIFGPG